MAPALPQDDRTGRLPACAAQGHATGAYRHAEDIARAAGLDGATVEPGCLAVGRFAAANGGENVSTPSPLSTQHEDVIPNIDISAEVRWWFQVAAAYARSPIVGQVLDEIRRSAAWTQTQQAIATE